MSKLVNTCPICNRKASEVSHKNFAKSRFITLDCGHTFREELRVTDTDSIVLKDGKVTYPFQTAGIHFAEKSGFNCLIGDEQGLGKTIQATGLLSLHLDELKPVLIVVKASLTIQWQKYILQQLDKFAQIVDTKSGLIPGLSIYLATYDTVGKLESEIHKAKIKTLILDECQMIKSHEAKRTNAIRSICNLKIKKGETPENILVPTSGRLQWAKTRALDLMKYHGIAERFTLKIERTQRNHLGLTKCRVKGEGIIVGEIILSLQHVENDSEEEILETILHEIAHAITPGAGHIELWRQTSLSIGGNGKAFANCDGSVEVKAVDDGLERMIKYKIFLSGTPIKNNAVEFWPSLNLLRPEMFPNRADWLRWDVGYWLNSKGVWKPGGLKYPEEFKKKTLDFIIRRERAEVFPELPEITRDYRYHDLSTDEMKAYSLGVKKLKDFIETSSNKKSFEFASQLQGHIMILRHITGLAKVIPIVEFVDEFIASQLESGNENWKLPIFHHHIDVGTILSDHLSKREQVKLARIVASDDASARYEKLRKLRSGEVNVLLFPSLAAAEGFDLDFCETGVLLEREWNPANEEQIEGRFIRATTEMLERARNGEAKATLVYPVAVNTIDEYFAELVERKRQYVKETLRGEASQTQWNESQIMMDLAEIAIRRLKS